MWCGFQITRINFQPHAIHSTNSIICEYCTKNFSTEDEKKLHLITTHANIYKFSCENCDERYSPNESCAFTECSNDFLVQSTRFKRYKDIAKHKKVVHTVYAGPIYELLATYDAAEESVFVPKACVVCDTKLSTSRQFHDHVKAHIDIKKIICVVCGKRFNFFSVLRVIRLFVKTLNRLIDMRIYFNDGQPCVFTATLDRSFKEGQFRNTSYSMQNMRHNAAESS